MGVGIASYCRKLPRIPLVFMGFGIHRAWFELAFTMPRVAQGGVPVIAQNWLDLTMIATLFACAALSHRCVPLHRRRAIMVGAPLLLIVATMAAYVGVFVPSALWGMRLVGSVTGGVGIGLMMLLWCERYAQLEPGRLILYYACMMVVGAAVIWLCRGFVLAWQPWVVSLLPLVSLAMLVNSYRDAPAADAHANGVDARFTFPWKPLVVVALYSFAFSLQYTADGIPGLYSSPGTIASALVVVGALLLTQGRVEFETIYSVWLPFMSAFFLLIPVSNALPQAWADGFNCLGYGANEIFIATMIGSIAYRYGVNAVWLYGIELGARFLVLMVGRMVRPVLMGVGIGTGLPATVAVVIATVCMLSEIKLDSSWGIGPRDRGAGECEELAEYGRNDVGVRCAELARAHALTQREGEVLLLLAQRKTTAEIEEALFIANGTAKAHISHVYQKIGVHTREELFETL